MTIVASTVVRPHPGKRATVESRARQMAGISARHGASVRVATVLGGSNEGCIAVLRAHPDFRSAARSFQAMTSDPAFIEFERERAANPAADMVMPRQLARVAYGELKWATHPFAFMRVYTIGRDNLAEAMTMLPDVASLLAGADVNVVCVTPVVGDNINSMMVSYQFHSLDHWGETLDTVGTSEEFQALLARAAKLGTAHTAFGMAPI